MPTSAVLAQLLQFRHVGAVRIYLIFSFSVVSRVMGRLDSLVVGLQGRNSAQLCTARHEAARGERALVG